MILYFALAALPSITQHAEAPVDPWAWFILIGTALYQGLLALKALDSPPDRPVTPTQVVSAPGIPLEVHDAAKMGAIIIAIGGMLFSLTACSAPRVLFRDADNQFRRQFSEVDATGKVTYDQISQTAEGEVGVKLILRDPDAKKVKPLGSLNLPTLYDGDKVIDPNDPRILTKL